MHHQARARRFGAVALLGISCAAGGDGVSSAAAERSRRATELAQSLLLVDTHIDVPYRLGEEMEDISQRTERGDFDYPRARAGGLDAAFFSIYVPASYQRAGGAGRFADELIDMVEGFARRWPDRFALARSPQEVRALHGSGRLAVALGIENGAAIEDDLGRLEHFYDRGVRYVTLAHSKDNLIADSSYDESGTWGGLSPFGRQVVAEMNRLGMMIDVSHVSDRALDQVLAASTRPVIASHSSCRKFTPGWERNLADEGIAAIGENGGVVHINFGSAFLTAEANRAARRAREVAEAYAREHGLAADDPRVDEHRREFRERHPVPLATVADVADHIDHAIALAGVDHVGLGSDFDGVGPTLPVGLEDVSAYPNLLAELLARGYSEADLEKIAGANLLRVWEENQAGRGP